MNSQVGLNNLVSIKSHWSFLLKGKLPYERMAELPAKLQQGPLVVFADGMSLFYACMLLSKVISGTSGAHINF